MLLDRAQSVSKLLVVCIISSLMLSGCFKKWDFDEVQEWYEEHPNNFDDYMRVAHTKVSEGRPDKAIQLYNDAIRDIEGQFGMEDLRIATAAEEVGTLEEKLHKNADAEANFRKALEVRIRNLPPNHLDVKRSRQKLAAVLRKQSKEQEAKDVLAGNQAGKSHSEKPKTRKRMHKRNR